MKHAFVFAVLGFALGLLFAVAPAHADSDYTQRCVTASLRENGSYTDNGDGTWSVICCGSATAADGGAMVWKEGPCESATAATLAAARTACRASWASKRCP